MQRLLVTLGLLMVTFGAVLAAVGGRAQTPAAPPAKPLYGMVYMHHYVGGGGFYPSTEDLRAFAQLTQKYQVPATFFFDGILVERLQKEDPTIFEYLNRLKVPLGYHGEETHGPYPVATNLMAGRGSPFPTPAGKAGSVTYGRSWDEAIKAVRERYSHRIVPGPIDPRTKQMDMRQGGQSDLTKIGGLALVQKVFGRDVSIITARSIESAPAGYAFQQLSQFRVEQPAIPTVGAAGAVMRSVPPELIREAMTIGGFENDFFWYMNRLQYKAGRQRTAENLPFRFMEVGLTATPPRWMDGVEDRLRQLVAQVKEVPGSRFVTPDELAGLFEPQNGHPISRDELRRLAEKLLADWKDAPPDFVDLGERGYSLVNACEALAKALAHYGEKRVLPDRVTATDLYGPIAERGEITYCKASEVFLSDLCAAAAATLKGAERLTPRRVPIKVAVGKSELNCAEFLRAMAQAYVALAKGNTPATVKIEPSKVMPPYADFLVRFFQPEDDRPLRYSQLQLWTVKPAVPKRAGQKTEGKIRDQPSDQWSEPVNVAEVNSCFADKGPAIAPDGKTLYVSSLRSGQETIYVSLKQQEKWSAPQPMTAEVNEGGAYDPSFTADGKTMYFHSSRPGGFGGRDIWYSTLEGGKWTLPKNAGPNINSAADEAKPMPFTFKSKVRLHLRHHYLNPRQPQTLELIKAEFARAQPREVLGVVTHEFNFAQLPELIAEWFKFLQAQGAKVRTVREIARTALSAGGGKQRMQTVPRWGTLELTIANPQSYANPFADVTLEATFTAPSGRQVKGWGFYDGGPTWRLRFMPDEVGPWRYEAKFSDGSPGVRGSFRCVRGKIHGPLRVRRENPLWFEHADGTPFYLRGFHLWWVDALDETTLAKTLDFLKAQGFNAIVGPHLGPHGRLPWERKAEGKGRNEQGEVDFSRFNLNLWRNLDRALKMLDERGMVLIPFSIFGGTNGVPKIPTWKEQDLFLRYWVARWGGFWNVTFQPTSEWEKGFSEAEILRIGSRLRELDGGRHLVSVHALKASSEAVQRAEWFAYHTVQDKLSDWNPMKYTWLVELHRRVRKPILAHECLWEGNYYQREAGLDIDNLRKAAWVIALCGGQINYADGIVTPGHWMRLEEEDAGKIFSERGMAVGPKGKFYQPLKVLGDFLQSLPFWRMTPQPELSSTGVCLGEVGREYVVYAPSGGTVTVDLTAAPGSFTARWFNPREGKFAEPFKIEGGGKRACPSPDGNDWVLHLTTQAR